MKSLGALSFVVAMASACGGGGSREPGVPIVSVNGTISVGGRNVIPAFGVAGSSKSGKSVGAILSDASTGCSALTADYGGIDMPEPGTYVAVALPGFEKGVAKESFVDFTVISKSLGVDGSGSNAGKVEVLDVTDTTVTIKVDYHDDLSIGDCVVSGDFTVTRCPSNQP